MQVLFVSGLGLLLEFTKLSLPFLLLLLDKKVTLCLQAGATFLY